MDEFGYVEWLGRGPLGATGEGEQLGEEPGKPLGLVLGGGQLSLDLWVAALQRRRLEPEAQTRERRAQLVRGVRDEVALVASVVPVRAVMSLNAVATSCCSGSPPRSRGRRGRLATCCANAGQSAQGLGERAGEEPRHDEAEQQREGAHTREREHVVALLGLHGVDALGHPHPPPPGRSPPRGWR